MAYIGKKPADIIATSVDTTTGTFSGDLTVDTNTLYVDSANNRVGVGTVSPNAPLEVVANSNAGIRFSDNGLSTFYHRIYRDNDNTFHISTDEGNIISASAIKMSVDGTEAMRIDSSGNLLVGGTSAYGTSTFTASSGGDIKASATGRAAIFNASTGSYSGSLVDFRVEDSAIGTIGTNSQHSKIAMFDSSGGFILGTTGLLPSTSAGAYYGGQRDLGTESVRWKDLYLSGSAIMGGLTVDAATNKNFLVQGGTGDVTEVLNYSSSDGYRNLLFGGSVLRFETGAGGGSSTSERMRIDSSGNLLVGKTSSTSSTVGCELSTDGRAMLTRNGGLSLLLNRTSSDGTIQEFRKDNSVVGSIGANSTQLIIGGTNTGIRFTGSQLNPMDMTTQTLVDNSKDIGASSYRWKDLYLSGGVYLGGTGSANKLDDYEEGTCTFTYTGSSGNPTVTYGSVRYGFYTKIGRKVFIEGRIRTDAFSGGSGLLQVSGLPFTVSNIDPDKYTSGGGIVSNDFASNQPHSTMAIAGTTSFYCIYGNYNVNNISDCQDGANKNQIQFSFFYMAI